MVGGGWVVLACRIFSVTAADSPDRKDASSTATTPVVKEDEEEDEAADELLLLLLPVGL